MTIVPKMATLDLGSAEISEATPELRWVPRSMFQAADLKLQQAWRIRVLGGDGRTLGSRMEWRDVPITHES